MAKQIDSEKLILWVEEAKQTAYECLSYAEGLENPEVLAQHRNFMLGLQSAYDNTIKHIRELQGSDDA